MKLIDIKVLLMMSKASWYISQDDMCDDSLNMCGNHS